MFCSYNFGGCGFEIYKSKSSNIQIQIQIQTHPFEKAPSQIQIYHRKTVQIKPKSKSTVNSAQWGGPLGLLQKWYITTMMNLFDHEKEKEIYFEGLGLQKSPSQTHLSKGFCLIF